MKTTVYNSLKPTITGLLIGLLIGVTLGPNHAHAQSRTLLDRMPSNDWSIDAQIGVGLPMMQGITRDKQNASDHIYAISLPSVQLGLRHMLSPKWGIRPAYAYHSFNNSTNDKLFNMHQAGVDVVYSLSDLFPEMRVRRRVVNVLVHGGGYYVWGSVFEKGGNPDETGDNLLTAVLGGTLQLQPRRSSRIAFTIDLSAHYNIHQNYGFDGDQLVSPGKPKDWEPLWKPTHFFVPSLGLHYYLGNRRSHVDWR